MAEGTQLTLFSAKTAQFNGSSNEVKHKRLKTITVVSTGVTSGCTVKVQGSPDGSNWADLEIIKSDGTSASSLAISATGNVIFRVPANPLYIRGIISAYTDGTHSMYADVLE